MRLGSTFPCLFEYLSTTHQQHHHHYEFAPTSKYQQQYSLPTSSRMYSSSNSDPTLAVLAIVCSSIGMILSLISLCDKCAAADDQQPHSTTITSQPVIPRSTVITIHDYEPPAPTYQPYPTYPRMPTPSSPPSSSSPLSYPPLAATSLSPAPNCPPVSQPQPPSYPPMARTQSTSSKADSTPPAYSASATS